MKKWGLLLVGAAMISLPAGAADVALDGGGTYASRGVASPAPYDQSTLELQWDNGLRRWSVAWYTGAGTWVGNDFNISTLKTSYVKILKYKFYTRAGWPNAGWDGMRFAFYNFAGGVPGSKLWPTGSSGYFFKPSGPINTHIWVEFDINWTCPSQSFVAAQEQFYNYPNCDPFSVDNNPTFRQHSWMYSGGSWSPLSGSFTPYLNLMVRVWVETGQEFPGVAPSSIGRVKALYY